MSESAASVSRAETIRRALRGCSMSVSARAQDRLGWPLTGREEREAEIVAAFYRAAAESGLEKAVEAVAYALAKAEEDRDGNT